MSRLTITLDCIDAAALSAFWSETLGYSCQGSFGAYWWLVPPDALEEPRFVLQQVSEPRTGKNRMHLDIHVADVDAEAVRLEALGARRISDALVVMGDISWFVMADPEGNEFCIVQPPG